MADEQSCHVEVEVQLTVSTKLSFRMELISNDGKGNLIREALNFADEVIRQVNEDRGVGGDECES